MNQRNACGETQTNPSKTDRECPQEARALTREQAFDAELDALLHEDFESDDMPAPVLHDARRSDPLPGAEPTAVNTSSDRASVSAVADAEEPAYKFPLTEPLPAHQVMSAGQLLNNLTLLSRKWEPDGSAVRPYSEIRADVCSIGIALSILGVSSPRFWPLRKMRPPVKGKYIEDVQLLNDCQVLDLHWLCTQKKKVRFLNPRWDHLFEGGVLDFDAASLFVATTGAPDLKVTQILAVRRQDQLELSTLQTDAIRGRWKVIQKGRSDKGGRSPGMEDVRRQLESAAIRHPVLERLIDGWVLLWACAELGGEQSGPLLARLYSLATASPLADASNLRRSLRKIERHLRNPAS